MEDAAMEVLGLGSVTIVLAALVCGAIIVGTEITVEKHRGKTTISIKRKSLH
jgi:hypothetical protein